MPPKLTPDDFQVPPLASVGERRKDKIHLAAGRAIHSWEVVEYHLGRLFGDILGTTVPVGALRAYGSVAAFNVRQQMLMQAADAFFHYAPNDPLKAEFKRVVKTIGDLASARRNEIAHGLVIGQNKGYGLSFFLVPSYHSARKRSFSDEPSYQYTSKEIAHFTGKFSLLSGEVHRLNLACSDWRAESQKKPRERRPPP